MTIEQARELAVTLSGRQAVINKRDAAISAKINAEIDEWEKMLESVAWNLYHELEVGGLILKLSSGRLFMDSKYANANSPLSEALLEHRQRLLDAVPELLRSIERRQSGQ